MLIAGPMASPLVSTLIVSTFVLLIASEIYFGPKYGKKVYRLNEVLSHLSVGLGQILVNIFTFGGILAIYNSVYESFHLFEFNTHKAWHWALTVLLVDFTFYFAHRLAHRVNFLIATHSIHHQPEDFNHISGFRQNWLNRPVMFSFYLPLAMLGVPTEMIATGVLMNLAGMFWSHNGVIERHLGWIEKILVTPRSHRIHHGSNAPYLDKNFGGLFIFWDYLFGTHVDLDKKVPLQIGGGSWKINHLDAAVAHWDYYARIIFVMRKRKGFLRKLAIWFQGPEVLDAELKRHHYNENILMPDRNAAAPSDLRTILAFSGVLAMILILAWKKSMLSLPAQIICAGITLYAMIRMNRMVALNRFGKKAVTEETPELVMPHMKIDVKNVRYDNAKNVEFQNTLKARVNAWFKKNHAGNRKATPFMWAKVVFIMSLFWWNWHEIAFKTHSTPGLIAHLALAAVLFMTIAYSVAHDAVHNAISGNPTIDNIIYLLTFNVLGANYYLWRYRHNNAHHYIVNIPGWDLDIEGTKYIRFAPHVKWLPIHRYQHWYASFLYMLFTIQWIVVKDFKMFFMNDIGNKGGLKHSKWRLVELIALKLFYFGYTIAIPAIFLPYSLGSIILTFVLFHFAFSYFLTLSFAYSHVGVATKFVFPDRTGKLPHSFAEHQLLTSVDFHAQNRFVGFIFGGFNAHVAHHIFPNLSSIHYYAVSKIIKETTKEFGIAYHEIPLHRMVASHYQFLKKMGSGPEGGREHVIYADDSPAVQPGLKMRTEGHTSSLRPNRKRITKNDSTRKRSKSA